jgi:trehalose 6-phosphate phosphatase
MRPIFRIFLTRGWTGWIRKYLGIAGKPAPDIFLEAARQLQVKPARAVVIEDAVSGVQAGRAGKFGLVIGIARRRKRIPAENGADVVVEDLSEIRITGDVETAEPLPSALDDLEKFPAGCGKTPGGLSGL